MKARHTRPKGRHQHGWLSDWEIRQWFRRINAIRKARLQEKPA